jgi:HEAT repeat protein
MEQQSGPAQPAQCRSKKSHSSCFESIEGIVFFGVAFVIVGLSTSGVCDANEPVSTQHLGNQQPKNSGFRIPESQVKWANELAGASLEERIDLKRRRPHGLENLESSDARQRAVEEAMKELGHEDRQRQEAAHARLKYLGEAALKALITGTQSDVPSVVMWSCDLLQFRGDQAVAPLSDVVKSSPKSSSRSIAVSSLGQTLHPSAIPVVIDALKDQDTSVKSAAIITLGYCQDLRAVTALQSLLDDRSVGYLIPNAIAQIESQNSNSWPADALDLLQLCRDSATLKREGFGRLEHERLLVGLKSKHAVIRTKCLFALGDLRAADAVSDIIALTDRDSVKYVVLSEIGTSDAVNHVIRALNSDDASVRTSAIYGLQEGADRWAAPLLFALLADPSLIWKPEKEKTPAGLWHDVKWPVSHQAHTAIFSFLSRFGLAGEWRNLYLGQSNDVRQEIDRLQTEWWPKHGNDFVAGKQVPNPNLSTVWYNDP